MAEQLPPVNHAVPPFGQTAAGLGRTLDHFTSHAIIQHPNRTHVARPQATVFNDEAGSANGRAGNARHHPRFTAGPSLHVGTRK